MTILDERMKRSAAADRCDRCRDLVQVRETGAGTVTLEAYRHPDGEYVITAELHAARTDGPFGYRKHRCEER